MTAAEPRDAQTRCDCGFVSARTSPRMAAYALSRHSCDRWAGITARRARGDAQRAAIDTTTRDCRHPIAHHQHGTRNAYKLDRCRCTPCRRANADYERRVHRLQGYGRWQPLVDAEPVRAHVQALSAQGIGWKRVAAAAGISSGGMTKLLYGIEGRQPSRRVRPDTAAALLAVTADSVGHAPGAFVPARPTWRRIEGLIALGYPKAWIAEQIGQQRALQLNRNHVLARTAQAVEQLHDRIGDTPGPSERARRYAAARRWLVPAYGTDEDIAEQARLPVEINREEREQRRRDVARLTGMGLSAAAIAQRLNIDRRQVGRDRATVREAS